jgi:hypothetical protein
MIRLKILFVFTSVALNTSAQVVIGTGQLAGNPGTTIAIQSSGNLINNSSFDFSAVNLNCNLDGNVTAISGDWKIKQLSVNSQSDLNLSGELTITEKFDLLSGVIQSVAPAKILYTGPGSEMNVDPSGNGYINGIMYQSGGGDRIFPVGTSSTFAPIRFFGIQTNEEIGLRAFDGQSPPLQADGVDVLEILPAGYWQIFVTDPSKINSPVNVGLRGTVITEGSPVVVQASALNQVVENLGNSTTGADDVTSKKNVTQPFVAVGRQSEVIVKIRDLITPFAKDLVNDGLFIEGLNQLTVKKVTLMDRWGVIVKHWDDYANENNYDFTTLAPGNYICVLEYGGVEKTSKISQMITVLKTN